MCYDEGDMDKELGSRALVDPDSGDEPQPGILEDLFREVDEFKTRLEKLEKRLGVIERRVPPVNINTYYARSGPY